MNMIPAGSNNQMLSLSDLYNIIETRIKDKAVGYAFVISYKEHFGNGSSGGFCRLKQDSPVRPMTVFEKYDCASVSKPMSAAALVLLLHNTTGAGLNSMMWEYLPAHWTMGPGIKTITFKELLTHHSGFLTSVRTYADLKVSVENGIDVNDKSDYNYCSTNYALLRLIIPKMAKYPILSLKGKTASYITDHEEEQATAFANAYIDYCRKNMFDKVGSMFNMSCNNDTVQPALYYSFDDQTLPGISMGDQTLEAGSRAWVMSTAQMAHFFRTLFYTEKIMPLSLSKKMREEHLGFGRTTISGVNTTYKSGSENVNGRNYRSVIVSFDNGVQIAMMSTSKLTLKNIAWDAFTEWYH